MVQIVSSNPRQSSSARQEQRSESRKLVHARSLQPWSLLVSTALCYFDGVGGSYPGATDRLGFADLLSAVTAIRQLRSSSAAMVL